ncbi:MAG: hypothetical protein ABSE62_12190 [Chthoniobacteraceae bacterium]
MTDPDKILDEARRLEPAPPRSKLDDYAEVIWELRRKRKRICAIADFLVGHGIRVGKSTVARWLKAHPPGKAGDGGRQFLAAGVDAERQQRAKDFFRTDSNHETTTKPYNLE